MATREEIGEILCDFCGWECGDRNAKQVSCMPLNRAIKGLHSQDVVIKLNEKLPSIFDGRGEVMSALEYKKKLEGYVLTVPLEGNEGNKG